MAEDSKASTLTPASALDGAEFGAGVQGGADRQITATQLRDYIVAQLQAGAPGALNTLAALAAALGNDADFAGSMSMALAGKQAASAALTNIAGVTPIADGDHVAAGLKITTSRGLILAIAAA